jgi:hypothetical protein
VTRGASPPPLPEVGLCSACRHASCQLNPRGNAFWRCRRAETEPDYLRYPPLPVTRCAGFGPGEPERPG